MPSIGFGFLTIRRATAVSIILASLLAGINQSSLPSWSASHSPTTQQVVKNTDAYNTHGIVKYTLPSGQELYVKPTHDQSIVTVDTWVEAGSIYENETNNGVSHFLEHLLFKGTDTHAVGELERMLESKGATFNAATSADFTHYHITTATPYFKEALDLHADMLLNAAIPADELNRERLVVQEEINRALDNPGRALYVTLSELMYGKVGYGLDTLGPKENIADIPRKNILAYYHYWYQPQNFKTIVVGDVDPDQVKDWVMTAFPRKPPKKLVSTKNYKPPTFTTPTQMDGVKTKVLESNKVTQGYWTLGFIGPSVQKPADVYALDIGLLALGDGKSSRLYRGMKEETPLVTSIDAGNFTRKETGIIYVDGVATPDNLGKAKAKMLKTLLDAKQQGITQQELDKAKTQYLKEFIFLNESTEGVASSLGYNVTIGTLQDYTDYVTNVQKVTLDDVNNALKSYLDFNRAAWVELIPEGYKALAEEEQQNLTLLSHAANNDSNALFETVAAGAEDPLLNNQNKTQTLAPDQATGIRDVLANGMTTLFKVNPQSQTVAIKIFIKGGQSVEPIPGVSSLASSMLTQGSLARNAQQLSEEMESKGISIAAGTSEDYVLVSGDAVESDLGEMVLLMQDILSNATFAPGEIDKQKQRMRQLISASQDSPSTVAFDTLTMNLYPDHPYGNVGKRIEPHLDLISRDDIVKYWQTYGRPENMLVVMVGKFNPESAKQYLLQAFPQALAVETVKKRSATELTNTEAKGTADTVATTMPNGVNPVPQMPMATPPKLSHEDTPWPRLATTVDPVRSLAESKTVETVKEKQAATWIAQGWLAPSLSDPNYVSFKVMNALLGTGMSSRLFQDIREKQGLAYTVGSFYPSRFDQSRFVMYIGTDPANLEQVQQAFAKEVERLKTEPIADQELKEAKDKLIGNFALDHETNAQQAFYLGLFEVLGIGYQFDTNYPKLVESVTAEKLQAIAQQYLSQPSVVSIVRPKTVANTEAGTEAPVAD